MAKKQKTKSTYEDLYDAALEGINALFANTSVSPRQTAEGLSDLKKEIDTLIDTLPVDEDDEEEDEEDDEDDDPDDD